MTTGLTDEELVTIQTAKLNKLIKEKGVPPEEAVWLKTKRRTLKNRGYAATCRVKNIVRERELDQELKAGSFFVMICSDHV
jgi:bZIP Maf transcription factor